MKFTEYFSNLPSSYHILIALLLAIVISFLNYILGAYLDLSVLYVLPILFTAYLAGAFAGLLVTALSILLYTASEVIAPLKPMAEPLSAYGKIIINVSIHIFVFVVVALALAGYRNYRMMQQTNAMMDPMTGLYNRSGFYEIAEKELKRDKRYGRPLSVASFDINNIKEVNEIHGEGMGNMLIQETARVAKNLVRKSDILARVGGDEFMIIFSETGDSAEKAVEKLQKRLMEIVTKNNWPVSFSIGLITYHKAPDKTETLMVGADGVRNRAKSAGPNSIKHETVDA